MNVQFNKCIKVESVLNTKMSIYGQMKVAVFEELTTVKGGDHSKESTHMRSAVNIVAI